MTGPELLLTEALLGLEACLVPVFTALARLCPGARDAQGRRAKCEPCVLSGEGGIDGDGDITRPENINAFRNFVLDNTDHKGVHFLMADGVGDLLFVG